MPRNRNLLFGPLPLLTALALAGGAAWALAARAPAAALVAREHRVLDVVRRVARAEAEFRSRGLLDRDHDGQAEFGSMLDLTGAGLLADVHAVVGGALLGVDGYRVAVLLPREAETSGRLTFARTDAEVDAPLAARFFAVAAMPRESEPSGLRAFYLDATGALWTAEGVCDGERRPFVAPPAHSMIEVEEAPNETGLVWRQRAGPPPAPHPSR